MKKKVMCMLLTGVMAASMMAGCGSNNAGGNAAATNDAATTDNAAASDDTAAGTESAEADSNDSADAAASDFDGSEFINVVSREDGSGTRGAFFIELFGIEEEKRSR